jgi:citrate lyase subunit beta-like protein
MTLDVLSLLSTIRQRRHILYTPGSELTKLSKASLLRPLDTLIFDLEDAVAPSKKDFARKTIISYLSTKPIIHPEFAIRINSISSPVGMRDLNEVILNPVISKRIDALVIPKLEDPDELRFMDRWLTLNGLAQVRMLGIIETPLGLTRVNEFCGTSAKLDALMFGSEDFRSAVGIPHSAGLTPILFARSAVVAAARAHRRQAIDMISLNFKNPDIVTQEAIGSRQFGFTGKQMIHPMHIDCVSRAFTLDAAEVKRLTKLIGGFLRTFYVNGKGIIGTNGVLVEFPHIVDAIRDLIAAGQSPAQLQKYVDKVIAEKV